jgi:hypothetical protein
MDHSTLSDPLEILWDNLLSRQPDRVRSAFAALASAEQQVVLEHLRRMSREAGWHPEQRRSACAALDALSNFS